MRQPSSWPSAETVTMKLLDTVETGSVRDPGASPREEYGEADDAVLLSVESYLVESYAAVMATRTRKEEADRRYCATRPPRPTAAGNSKLAEWHRADERAMRRA